MLKVLIVDDVDLLRRCLKSYMKDYDNLEFLEAKDFDSAVSLLYKQDIDIMFLDIGLSNNYSNLKTNGINLLKVLKANNLRIPYTVIVSGLVHKDKLLDAMGLGIKDALTKPVEKKDVRFVLEEAIRTLTMTMTIENQELELDERA